MMVRGIIITVVLFFYSFRITAQPFHISEKTASYIMDAVYSPNHNYIFFFSGSSVMLYDKNSTKLQESSWYEVLDSVNIEASLLWSDNFLLLFSGQYYTMYDIDSARVISDWVLWPNLPAEWKGKLDAAVRWSINEIMFFAGNEYLLYNMDENAYKERGLFTKWEGWPAKWQNNLQAVLNINGVIYFLKDGQFISANPETQKFSQPAPLWLIK